MGKRKKWVGRGSEEESNGLKGPLGMQAWAKGPDWARVFSSFLLAFARIFPSIFHPFFPPLTTRPIFPGGPVQDRCRTASSALNNLWVALRAVQREVLFRA